MAYPVLLQHSTQSAAFATEWEVEQTPGTASGRLSAPLIAVVGFDGSEPAKRALESAARLLRDRDGHLEVVYVAHELIAVGDELRRQNGPQATIVLIVGGSSHKHHRLLGSVSSNLERVDRFPVVVVP
jgi:nucleotide-binding universal stress UspA family protein